MLMYLVIGLQVCVKRKFLNTAFILFEEMKRYQIRPNLVSAMNSLTGAFPVAFVEVRCSIG